LGHAFHAVAVFHSDPFFLGENLFHSIGTAAGLGDENALSLLTGTGAFRHGIAHRVHKTGRLKAFIFLSAAFPFFFTGLPFPSGRAEKIIIVRMLTGFTGAGSAVPKVRFIVIANAAGTFRMFSTIL